ncbi:MAG: NAD(P)H-hydrate dehydratase [Pirellulaceae bacterium]|jgi:ADP-dependent NAD(P)H-hydrate dehydratase
MESLRIVKTIPRLPPRPDHSHKGMFGHALLAGGSLGMAGALILAGRGALRAGAGLVTLATPTPCQAIVAAAVPTAMTLGLNSSMSMLDDPQFNHCTLAIGPGLGRSLDSDRRAAELYESWQGTAILDADALNALAAISWRQVQPRGPRVLTPHPGEWSRLSGAPAADRAMQRQRAIEIAREAGVVVVLKGHRTLVTDGDQCYENTTGNPSMATGGNGDVLTGILAGLACQHLSPFDAAVLAVYLHGLSGDIAHRILGTPSTLPEDLLDHLPAAFQSILRTPHP